MTVMCSSGIAGVPPARTKRARRPRSRRSHPMRGSSWGLLFPTGDAQQAPVFTDGVQAL